MKIWGEIPKVSSVYGSKKGVDKTERKGNVTSTKDLLSISNQAKDFQTVMKALKDVPDIRQDKVNTIREKYEAGDYEVKEADITDKILKSISEEKE
jgi:negative regulator of flagellin synthesis FlgM